MSKQSVWDSMTEEEQIQSIRAVGRTGKRVSSFIQYLQNTDVETHEKRMNELREMFCMGECKDEIQTKQSEDCK